MSFQLPSQRTSVAPRKRWAGAAFLVEAMLLLLFLVASMAIFTQLFAATAERANESRNLTDAELLRCLSELDKRKKAGRPKNGSTDPGKSADRTASLLGISRAKVERLRAVADHGTETIKLAVLSGDLTVNRAYIITMEARRMDNCKTETDLKSTRLAILEKSISKGIKERTDLELRKHPDVRYAPAELHAMKGKIISKLDEALGKLKKGKK